MRLYEREDLVHGDWGIKLRKSSVALFGEGEIITMLYQLLVKSGYETLMHFRRGHPDLTVLDGFQPDVVFTTTLDIDVLKFAGVHMIWGGYKKPDGTLSYGSLSTESIDVELEDEAGIVSSATATLMCACSMLLLSQEVMKAGRTVARSYTITEHDGTPIKRSSEILNLERRIMVVGLGALGSHVAMLLAQERLSDSLTLVDYDEIRSHNLCRLALADMGDVGENKARCVASKLELSNCRVIDSSIEEISEREILEHDIVLSCCDRNTARLFLANICRVAGGTGYLQGGFGGVVSQFSSGSEIQDLFHPVDEPLNSCTGLIMTKTGTPTGATLGTVGLLAARIVRFIMAGGCQKEIPRYYSFAFPEARLEIDLPTPSKTPFQKRVSISLHKSSRISDLVNAMSEHFTDAYVRIDFPFIVDMACPICEEKVEIRRYKHVLSDIDRFHPECIICQPAWLHKASAAKMTVIEDRIHEKSDPTILSLELQHCGFMDGSIRPVCKDGVQLGYLQIALTDHNPPACNQIKFTEHALNSAFQHASQIYREVGHEAAGLLFGEIISGSIRVNKIIEAPPRYSSPIYVEMCPVWLTSVVSAETNEESTLLGWYHSHPGFSLQPSGRDVQTFRNFFRPPLVNVILCPLMKNLICYRVFGDDIETVVHTIE